MLYYVDSATGNNSNAGTSPGKPCKTIQKACNSANANATVYIKAGTYKENVVVNVSGTAGNPITFRKLCQRCGDHRRHRHNRQHLAGNI